MKAIYKATEQSLVKATLQQEVIPPTHMCGSDYLICRCAGSVNYIQTVLTPGVGIITNKYLLEIRKEYTLDYCMEQTQILFGRDGEGQ
jgi:hypothetical protein